MLFAPERDHRSGGHSRRGKGYLKRKARHGGWYIIFMLWPIEPFPGVDELAFAVLNEVGRQEQTAVLDDILSSIVKFHQTRRI